MDKTFLGSLTLATCGQTAALKMGFIQTVEKVNTENLRMHVKKT